ncbi:hypothetical protein DXV75_07560 [Alteromonas aestuariivivens]|uniref:Uncharacterized protein n=1 Tax=Alteromonas aestuariivivens TaxID=1938339 RepID=A0A3D8MAG1_9ALTE|nr:hypothetical protein [Alteromonas aestuariivivens]RDV26830.1 hypothetical protein DXV75_07560 [Alteromonas aestuariivivens]
MNAMTLRLAIWTGVWLVCVALVTFGAQYWWDYHPVITVWVMLVYVGSGVKLILVNRAYLQNLDELQRKIQLDAMTGTLGVGLVAGIGYDMADNLRLIDGPAQISILVMVMAVCYVVLVLIGSRRYQ